MAKVKSHRLVFFRLGSHEGYLTEDGPRVREMRANFTYLGDKANENLDQNVESLRIKRAIDLLEKSGGPFLKQTKDRSSRKRLGELFKEVLRFDNEQFSPGLRSVYRGLRSAEGRSLLNGFDFNARSRLCNVVGQAIDLDLEQGLLCWSNFSPQLILSKTVNVSQFEVCFLISRVDFLRGEFMSIGSDVVSLTAQDPVQDLRLKVGPMPDGDGVLIASLWLGFERDDAVTIPGLLRRVDDVFRVVGCEFL